jgi:DNA-directed RNA polymerase I subunit RPA43
MDFKVANTRLKMNIAPIYASNLTLGISKFFESLLMRYLPEAKGVLVTYKNVKFESTTANVINESPFLQFYITVDLILFSPSLNSTVKGRVCKISDKHIGLLIHGSFNASISGDELTSCHTWDEEKETWRSKKGSKKISNGAVFEFRVKGYFLYVTNDYLGCQERMRLSL